MLIDPQGAWAIGLTALPAQTGRTLIQMARDIYPHSRLEDVFYAKAVEPYDLAASKDPAVRALLVDGTADLDQRALKAGGAPYADTHDEAVRLSILKAIEPTPFFQKLRGDLVVTLYNQPDLWAKFGYEGSSAEKGGYLHRGFNDLDWLNS